MPVVAMRSSRSHRTIRKTMPWWWSLLMSSTWLNSWNSATSRSRRTPMKQWTKTLAPKLKIRCCYCCCCYFPRCSSSRLTVETRLTTMEVVMALEKVMAESQAPELPLMKDYLRRCCHRYHRHHCQPQTRRYWPFLPWAPSRRRNALLQPRLCHYHRYTR